MSNSPWSEAFDFVLPNGEQTLEIVEGGARGVDTLAKKWAKAQKKAGKPVRPKQFRADWDKWGTSAGPIRNRAMAIYLREAAKTGEVVGVIAIPSKKRSVGSGTWNMVAQAWAQVPPIQVFVYEDAIV